MVRKQEQGVGTFNVSIARISKELHQDSFDSFGVINDGLCRHFQTPNVVVGQVVLLHTVGHS